MSRSAQQSPVDLTDPIVTDFGEDSLRIEWSKGLTGTMRRDERGARVDFNADEREFVVLDRKRFHIAHFHVHSPSEHWVRGRQQTMEVHVVHESAADGSRVVLGIFVEASKSAAGGRPDTGISANPNDYLPDDTRHYYRYEGSLTTPPYTEDVSWVVLRDPLLLPEHEVATLIERYGADARLPQPLNRRFVLANFVP